MHMVSCMTYFHRLRLDA